ncbi:NAD(+) diphosphatase [Geosporobacter ferrireducens]|uniref:NAD(+) diphosphatase n=1 Tax=Geosporobacter ferrireducens TaxID=1424294 RepID=A0A1D8GN64_9FIRM|nr:NAD(+) diphosphatase [Geosporobacter ferrireducens]AOT72333.1 NADH pyrophosphatase [Geosporobacter ferrireducens]MTI56413.1 NAD(+) diphosphatase [Geosporobacter ferrireducens]
MYTEALNLDPTDKNTKSLWFLFCGNKLMVSLKEDKASIPVTEDISELQLELVRNQYIGKLGGIHCFCAEVNSEEDVPPQLKLLDLRQLMGLVDEEIFWMAGKAFQIMDWDRTFQFCGKCGSPTETIKNEHAKVCTSCKFINYPRISPAIIVAVVKDKQLLLARGKRFTAAIYSVLAGFAEPGETLEECVAREVMEEVGIKIKNISYFGSQPWPFPNSLMIAFTAEYESGEIKIDENELLDAGWFTAQNIPPRPSKISIASKLIDWFIENH